VNHSSPPIPHRRPSRRVGAIVLVAGALLAAACGSSATDASRFGGREVRHDLGTLPPSGASTTEAPPAYPVKLTSLSCPFAGKSANGLNIECKTLVVPMSRTKLDGKTVSLAVAIIHSTSPTPLPDPVLYLDGGPGGSALASVDMWTKPVSSILENRDIILIDQRGTGYSQPHLVCDRLIDNDQSQNTDVIVEECLRTLRNDGAQLEAFNTTENAADVANLRKALNLPSWNLFGISYGTRLALWVMKNHPEGIRSVVIDSVYPPGVNSWESIAPDLYRAVHQIMLDCGAQPACATAFPDLDGQLTTAIDKLNKFGNTGDIFVHELFNALYISEIMPDIPKAIAAAAHDDQREAFELLEGKGALRRHPELRDSGPPSSARTRPAMSEAMNHSVECAESAPLTSPDALRAAYKPVPDKLGDVLLTSYLQRIAICNVWSVGSNPLSPVTSDIPTLVLAGTYDPITPPEWGKLAASTLPNSTYVEIAGSGHAVWAFGDCPKALIKAYLDDPKAPGPDCTVPPPTFEV
jgi:pimeloyl-ACP methyl ester carboxylesterase